MSSTSEEYAEQRVRLTSLLDATISLFNAINTAWKDDGQAANSVRIGGKVYTGEIVDFLKSLTDAVGNASSVCEEAKTFLLAYTPETLVPSIPEVTPASAEVTSD